ncbi:MAG: hypothetical protein ABIB43_05395 [archaeon]
MSEKEDILNFVKSKGPIIPNDVKKALGGDTFLISARLSELSSEGHVKISHTKIGGSPCYYAPGQEYKLIELKKYLNPKDQKTVDLLRERKVLKDRDQDMLTRVSLRQIKDFAKPLKVNMSGEQEIFWKWYQTSADEAEAIIRKQMIKTPETPKPIVKPEQLTEEIEKPKEVKKEIEKEETKYTSSEVQLRTEQTKEVLKAPGKTDGFLGQVYDYFKEKKIEIISENIIRIKTDLEFEVIVPSSVGKVEYFCKAKNKKKCTDGDLSSVYLTAQSKKLPVLFLTTGDVTKKAQEMLKKEFKGLVLKKI